MGGDAPHSLQWGHPREGSMAVLDQCHLCVRPSESRFPGCPLSWCGQREVELSLSCGSGQGCPP